MAAEAGSGESEAAPWNPEVAAKGQAVFARLPPPAIHYAGLSAAEVGRLLRSEEAYGKLMREKAAGEWFAALVSEAGPEPYAIHARFATWQGLVEFLAEQNALVEVWACGEGGDHKARRIPAAELAELKRQRHELPTLITATVPDPASHQGVTYALEFGLHAAAAAEAANRAYQRHRSLQSSAHRVLGARNADGLPDAQAQWAVLQTEAREHRLGAFEPPPKPKVPQDVFVAFEFEVDEQNNFVKVAGLYRASELGKRIRDDAQVLLLEREGEKAPREVVGFWRPGLGDHLERAPGSSLGRDIVQLRVKDPAQPDPGRWHVLEFGESELLKQSALAHFSQLEAYLEHSRKVRLMRMANLALVAEPVIAGMNIGGGVTGVGFPLGESARLLYNLITWRLISNVPTVKQMRELFALMAARERNPQLKAKGEAFLNRNDLRALRKTAGTLTDREIQTYLEQMSLEDIRAMLRLARQGMLDARVTTFLNELTSAFKVSGVSEQAGLIRDLFNNVRFSMNGDINLLTLLMIAINQRVATPLSGASLQTLSQGDGPQEAWMQYLGVSVDLRAVVNTLVRLFQPTFAKKELERPFPYAPRMSELAAYEVRIFGFPLLMFYKRGLIKADVAAYEHDYAYGLIGVRVVERFPTRAALEAEVRAGRLYPLGLVRALSAGGHWKETDLVVYAHRIPTGKHRGKTALIIYGMKAYLENSEELARELLRFREYEKGLSEGAVIEQTLPEEAASPPPGTSWEPVIHAGPEAVRQVYEPLLSALLELRGNWQRKNWGLAADEEAGARARGVLEAMKVVVPEGDPLAAVSPFYSSFVYRRRVGGREEQVRVTSIPSPGDIEREVEKAEEARWVEEQRREAATGRSAGVVLLNEAREVNGRLEMGALLHDGQDRVAGAGVTSGAKAVEAIFELVERLPVTDRARLLGNHFAATAVELEREGQGRRKVFLTLEFPPGEVRQERTNPLSGERETVCYENGLWRKTISDRRIVEVDYDAAKVEARSRTYANRGTRRLPAPGALIEETRTLEYWARDLRQPDLDPYQPVIAKLRVNYVSGQFARETFGLFPLPVETADEQFITRNQYTPYGLLASASIFDNGRDERDFSRPWAERALQPISGRQRAELTCRLAGIQDLRDAAAIGYRLGLERNDLVKGLATTQTFDLAHDGRKIAEDFTDHFDGTQTYSWQVTWAFEPGFHFGLVPRGAATRSVPSGALLSEVVTTGYDPLERRLTGVETTYAGLTRTNTWDYRWESPVQVEGRYSRTMLEYERDGMRASGVTTLKANGEVLDRSAGQFDAAAKTWRTTRWMWLQPDVPPQVQTNTYSAFGLLMGVRAGDALETRPAYGPDARERARATFGRNGPSGRYDVLCRQEDDYQWQAGRRSARVRLFVEGRAVEECRAVSDAEGRVVEDGIRQWPGLELRTRRTFQEGTDRLRGAEVLQNGQVRATHRVVGLFRQGDGQWRLKVAVTPFWGLSFTNSYSPADPLGRAVETEFENGDRARVTAWFGDTALARETEVFDRQGHARERLSKRPLAGAVAGFAYDLVTRYRVSPWGEAVPIEVKALAAGTDVALFADSADERVHFDLSKNYECSRFTTDLAGRIGLRASIGGRLESNVTAVFSARFRELAGPGASAAPRERVLELAAVDLRGLYYYPFSRRTFDRAGQLLQEESGALRNLAPRPCSDTNLLAELSGALPGRRTLYAYERAWARAQAGLRPEWALVPSAPGPATNSGTWSVNDAGWREWPTKASSYQLAPGRGPGGMAAATASNLVSVLRSPRWLRQNPHLPGVTDVWMAWTEARFNAAGAKLFESELILDARGELSALLEHKRTSHGRAATKAVYALPRPPEGLWRGLSPPAGSDHLDLSLSGPQDLSGCDFIGFYLEAPASARVSVRLQDRARRSLLVARPDEGRDNRTVSFWPVDQGWASWLPNESLPVHGAVVSAPWDLVEAGRVFVLSIPELARAGLAVNRLAAIVLSVAALETNSIRLSPLYRLEPGGANPPLEGGPGFDYDSQAHSSGLAVHWRKSFRPATAGTLARLGWGAVLEYEGVVVGALNPRQERPHYPVLVVTDNSDPDSPRPLYALAAEDGRFLEYYNTLGAGDAQVYTAANGFNTPKMEVYRGGILDDELTPGVLAFGQGYQVILPLAKASGGVRSALAALRNRCVANAFALGGQQLLPASFEPGRVPRGSKELLRQQAPAAAQAQVIDRLPTLAEALLSRRIVPWREGGAGSPAPAPLSFPTNFVLTTLRQLSEIYTNTGLIPTSPGGGEEAFVDTVQEAALIELAVKLRDPALAKDALAFYWQQSQGGASPLHASYNAETGASLTRNLRYQRPTDSAMTARAQLAMAQAAFCLGTATGDRNALEFGANLVALLLDKFRPGPKDTPWPAGIAEQPVEPVVKRHGLTLWPEPKTFSVGSNARAYLLLRRLAEEAASYPFGPQWRRAVIEGAEEEAAWLTNRIAPWVQATGVVPKGLFELQDVNHETRALVVERWTTTDDWLGFLEAAERLGVSRELTRVWLDNLARAHGVTVQGVWGLDWTMAVQRPDAISTDLTAEFLRVAELLGEEPASGFARENLRRLRVGDGWPAVRSSAGARSPIQTSAELVVYPAENAAGEPAKRSGGLPAPLRSRRRAPEAGGRSFAVAGWPLALGLYAQLAETAWPARVPAGAPMATRPGPANDITQFFWTAAALYLGMVAMTLFWWALSFARGRQRARVLAGLPTGQLVPESVMGRAEERWAKRVLGMRVPAGGERSRYANGAIEQNFHLQLRALYKLVLEWRRLVNAWPEDDARLVEGDQDAWLNGMDEFAVMVGIYIRWVVKAGRKDGLPKADVLAENEDSNHIWSRLVVYFSESHQRLLALIKEFKADPAAAAVLGTNDQIELVLRTAGVRARAAPFDARRGFDAPSSASALDLLLVQLPGASLARIVQEMEHKWDVPSGHVVSFIKGYKSFKEREQLYPIHFYLLETAKILPHFCLMGLVGLIWYNQGLGGLRIYPYLRQVAEESALNWRSLLWAAPLFAGFALSVCAHALRVYRYRWGTRRPGKPSMALDAAITGLFGQATEAATPALRTGWGWNPLVYERAGWVFRAVGLGLLAVALFGLDPPSFATFMCVKGMAGILLLAEAAGLLAPLVFSRFSSWLEDRVSGNPRAGRLARFLNQLNLVPTRPASLLWLSIKYHFQPSVPTGGFRPMVQAIASYLFLGATFFFVGSYMCKQALDVWLQETYRHGSDLRLMAGAWLFWNTMYLLRFGLFVLLATLASAAALYPIRLASALGALGWLAWEWGSDAFAGQVARHAGLAAIILVVSLVLIAFESELLAWLRNSPLRRRTEARRREKKRAALEQLRLDPNRALGVVYMSGDDLSFYKLTPELLLTRLGILRDRLGSGGARLLARMQTLPDDAALGRQFAALYELERRHEATLWHPGQLVVAGERPWLRPELGLNLLVDSAAQREQLLGAWHLRRWLVTMMSTAGHAQDTAINLVDIALCLAREGLGANTAFYLIQNKYDNHDNNRPSQLAYDKGELGQRNKLARLLMEAAPGSRAYSVNDWTPFGFKAGGLVGMDLVFEESLRLTNMLVLDRNATAHDLEAVLEDLKLALSDPGVVIVIPGRSTTNNLTPIGQGSQLIEEGHRALTRGVMLLGGVGGESLGTGWGNIQAVYYGRVQRALCDVHTSLMPLTTAATRNATFGDRCEGLIGFGPHAVGISEDIWGVTQAAHNALALGCRVQFRKSRALWHKLRETWSHAEWLSAFPRWSGGYLQMMLDPLMQRINDGGPMPVFAKEIRADGGRFFLSAPAALLSILLMPLAIIWDFSPFVQILILLWNLGLVMNQVLTALGFVACLEATGFSRLSACAGGLAAAGLAAAASVPMPLSVPLLVLGFLAGGFLMGLGRWLYYRGRDLVLFGPQLVIHTLGQLVRQGLEFVLSGASADDAKAVNIPFRAWVGPREDRPLEGYQNLVNLRTVVWGVGLPCLLLNLFALANLDFLNALLLLPSLMFSVSALVGPFLAHPKPGVRLGWAVWAPKLLGWLGSFLLCLVLARLIADGGWHSWLAAGLCGGCLGGVLRTALRYVGYPRRVERLLARLAGEMAAGGMAMPEARRMASHIAGGLRAEAEKTRAALANTTLPAECQASVLRLVQDRLLPLLSRPLAELHDRAAVGPRFISECSRSFVLGLFTFVWLFVVPMPGLLVFTAPGDYRIALLPSTILSFAAAVLAVVFAAGILSLGLEWWEKHRLTGRGLVAAIEAAYRSFRSLAAQPGRLAPAPEAQLHALFTDVQTYFDQRSYAYAWATLGRIERLLKTAAPP